MAEHFHADSDGSDIEVVFNESDLENDLFDPFFAMKLMT